MASRVIPSRRVYKLPDFVIFSHARHVSKLDCGDCHGDVNTQDALRIERPTTMKACVDCHKSHAATVVCTACHELTQ
jgi:Cytochrome c7 and related cytochrome c